MSFEPKRQWKRYDPEPEPKDEADPLVVVLWAIVALMLAVNIALQLGGGASA